MDEIARYNKERWEELARANVVYSRPYLDLNRHSAREVIDPEGMVKELQGKDVLCLASGGGQQSAAFALLGAKVTVLDISELQLERDQQAGRHYDVRIETQQGDMRDLSRFGKAAFDIVYHPYSLSFVPNARQVFREVARVLREDGLYHLQWHNPFTEGFHEDDWDGRGYPLRLPYIDGAEIVLDDPHWEIGSGNGTSTRVVGPREFRHTLSAVVNGLVAKGFVILGVWEEAGGDPNSEPGTWEHLMSVAPPWLTIWATYRPCVFADMGLPT